VRRSAAADQEAVQAVGTIADGVDLGRITRSPVAI
jgi:hypothetical protein